MESTSTMAGRQPATHDGTDPLARAVEQAKCERAERLAGEAAARRAVVEMVLAEHEARLAELSERAFEHENRSISEWLHDRERGLVPAGPRRDPVSRRLATEHQAVAALVRDLIRLRDQHRRDERAVRGVG